MGGERPPADDDRPAAATGTVEELVFAVTDPSYPFVGLSRTERCRVELERMLPRDSGRYAEYFTVEGTDPDRVMALAEDHDGVDPTVLARREDGGLFEFEVSGYCPARHLAELGALPRAVESTNGEGRIVAEVPPAYDATEITAAFLDEQASAELAAKCEKEHATPLFTDRELKRAIDGRLTDKQQEVLRVAYETGYYERPREKTGEEIADELDISGPTFSQHIRAAERNLLSILYDEETM